MILFIVENNRRWIKVGKFIGRDQDIQFILKYFSHFYESLFLHAPFSEFRRNSFSVVTILFSDFSVWFIAYYTNSIYFFLFQMHHVSSSYNSYIQLQSFYDKYSVIFLLDVSKIFINIQLIGNKEKEKEHWERTSRSDSRNVHIFFGGNVISFSIKDDTVPLAFDYYTIEQLLIRWANQMMARWWWEAFENEISLEARLLLWIFCL